MFYIMLALTVTLWPGSGHRKKVQQKLAEWSGRYGTTRVIEFENRLSTPALLIAVITSS